LDVGIGAGVFLIAAGAILAFAVDYEIAGIELNVVGWILMGAGALALILSFLVWGPRRRTRRAVITDDRQPDEGIPPQGGRPPIR
jgi:hypothetical protein